MLYGIAQMGFQNWILDYPMFILTDLISYGGEINERLKKDSNLGSSVSPANKTMTLNEARKHLRGAK